MPIHVDVVSNKDGNMTISVDGHSTSDICSSVSTLLQSQVRFMQDLAEQFPDQIKVRVIEID